jgi:hypothetical protein
MDQKAWYNFFRVLIPFVLAYLSRELIVRFIGDKYKLQEQRNEKIDEFRGYIDKIIIHLLLPSVFLFSLIFSNYDIAQLPTLLVLGLVLPLFVIFFSLPAYYILLAKKRLKLFFLPFMPATFGGGNRGTLLILIFGSQLIGFANSNLGMNDLIAFFAIIDFGNFVFLIFVMEYLMKFIIKKEMRDQNDASSGFGAKSSVNEEGSPKLQTDVDHIGPSGSIQGDISDFFKWLSPATLAVILFISVISKAGIFNSITKKHFFIELLSGLQIYSSVNSSLFVYAAFLSMFLMLKKDNLQKKNMVPITRGILFGLATRALGSIFIFTIFFSINVKFNFFETSEVAIILVCLSVFLILPPSSIFPTIADATIERIKKDLRCEIIPMKEGVSQLAQITLYSNLVYMGLIFAYLLFMVISN